MLVPLKMVITNPYLDKKAWNVIFYHSEASTGWYFLSFFIAVEMFLQIILMLPALSLSIVEDPN